MIGRPGVVDHDQEVPLLQPRTESLAGLLGVLESGGLARELVVQLGQRCADVGVLAQGDPEDAVVKRLANLFVEAEGLGQRRLAEPPRAPERRCDRDRFAPAHGVGAQEEGL